jgi:hypothetical protein
MLVYLVGRSSGATVGSVVAPTALLRSFDRTSHVGIGIRAESSYYPVEV